jgi:hypothetical protein
VSAVAELDEVQYDLEVDGDEVRRQLARRVWERGGWATIAITFVERERGGDWSAPQLALLRFRKQAGAWHRHAAVTVPVAELAQFLSG